MSSTRLEKKNVAKAILFDLDGTLVDSVGDLRAAVNRALVRHKLDGLKDEEVVRMIGHGMQALVRRAFAARGVDLDDETLQREYQFTVDSYLGDLYTHTVLLHAAEAAIDTFVRAKIRVAVVTNKPQTPSDLILERFALLDRIDLVVGGDLGIPNKPAPDMLQFALAKIGVAPTHAVMVGDSRSDVDSARDAGVKSVCIRGGYANGDPADFNPDRILNSLAELDLALFTSLIGDVS